MLIPLSIMDRSGSSLIRIINLFENRILGQVRLICMNCLIVLEIQVIQDLASLSLSFFVIDLREYVGTLPPPY